MDEPLGPTHTVPGGVDPALPPLGLSLADRPLAVPGEDLAPDQAQGHPFAVSAHGQRDVREEPLLSAVDAAETRPSCIARKRADRGVVHDVDGFLAGAPASAARDVLLDERLEGHVLAGKMAVESLDRSAVPHSLGKRRLRGGGKPIRDLEGARLAPRIAQLHATDLVANHPSGRALSHPDGRSHPDRRRLLMWDR